jgi:hypothetical protein
MTDIRTVDEELVGTVARAIDPDAFDNRIPKDGPKRIWAGRREQARVKARAAIEASQLLQERDEARNRVERLEGALTSLVALHDAFMTASRGFMGNQADAYYCIAKRFDEWNDARAALTGEHNG